MIYVTSDLHGYPLEKMEGKLKSIGFGEQDHLYILGDCIDRGSDGPKIVRWCMSKPNVTMLLGNHEAMLLENRFIFDGDTVPSLLDVPGAKQETYERWLSNGGYTTVDAFTQFTRAQTKYIVDYIERAPLYKEIEVNGKRYVLTHSGLGNFAADKPLSEYTLNELVWDRPDGDTRYYDDGRMVIFGHTPTILFGSMYRGRPLFTDTWIDIDVGVTLGVPPCILRLDDKKEFYV